MARRNLFTERLRFLISVLGVGFAVVLVTIVLSLFRGWSGIGGIFADLPGSLLVAQGGTTDPFHSVSILSDDLAERLAARPDVRHAIPVRARRLGFLHDGAPTQLYLMALDTSRVDAPPRQVRERFLPAPDAIVIDRVFAKKTRLRVGDRLEINDVPLVVERITTGGNAVLTQFAFVAWADAARILAPAALTSYVLLEPASGVSADDLRRRLAADEPATRVFTNAEFADTVRQEIEESFLPVVTVILVLGAIIGGAVVGLTIYTATVERRREYAVLKALGASRARLVQIVLAQSLMVALVGFAAGLALAVGVAALAEEVVPEFITTVRWQDVLVQLGGAVAVAVLAALLPVRRVAQVDPASVFRA